MQAGAANPTRVTRFKEAGGSDLARADTGASDGASPDLLSARQLSTQPSGVPRPPGRKFTDRDEHLFFWTPLLVGLSELTFDPRPKVRYSSLEVLFNILTEHGHCFTESFWQQARPLHSPAAPPPAPAHTWQLTLGLPSQSCLWLSPASVTP